MQSLNQRTSRGIEVRIFLTCWIIFVLHFATNFVREHYLVVSMVEDATFRLDRYADMHVDIFVTPEHGVHHGANPGASMIAALPYFLFRPAVDWVVGRERAARAARDGEVSAVYEDHRPARTQFYRQARERGLDIRFGLVGFITMAFCMAPLSALSAIVMFRALRRLDFSQRLSLGLAFLYALGTPIFFRTHYLNQNLMLGLFGFMAFVLLWLGEPSPIRRWRYILAGVLGGLAFLCDYSGAIVLGMLGVYVLLLQKDAASWQEGLKNALWYTAGAVGPILLLGFYQWQSFGNPFYPPQHYMPPVQWIEVGYQGVGLPSGELIGLLLFDYRFGLFTSAPILMLSLAAPALHYFGKLRLPLRETLFSLALFFALTLFFSCVQYTRLQNITGIRYIVPVIPFLFLLTAAVLVRLPRLLAYLIALLAFTQAWCMAMVSDEKTQAGILASVKAIFIEGFQLPWLNTLHKMAAQYAPTLQETGVSPIPLFIFFGLIIYGIWRFNLPWEKATT